MRGIKFLDILTLATEPTNNFGDKRKRCKLKWNSEALGENEGIIVKAALVEFKRWSDGIFGVQVGIVVVCLKERWAKKV